MCMTSYKAVIEINVCAKFVTKFKKLTQLLLKMDINPLDREI